MTTFALIHGAWGSGWHWASIPERLRALGHDVVAPDMPCDDPAATFDDYAQVAVDALAGVDEDVVVVGFSMGGLAAPVVAARRPVRAVVYISGVLPLPGASLADQMGMGQLFHPDYAAGVEIDDRGRTVWRDVDVYHRVGYGADVPREVVQERFDRLRPQAWPLQQPTALERWPDVPARYVLCTQDRLMDNAFWAPAVRDRLGIEPTELASAHTPIVSHPAEITTLLTGSDPLSAARSRGQTP